MAEGTQVQGGSVAEVMLRAWVPSAMMLDTVIWGLTAPARNIQEHNQEIAAKTLRPAGIIRASRPV